MCRDVQPRRPQRGLEHCTPSFGGLDPSLLTAILLFTRAGLRHRPTRPWPRAPLFKGPRAKQSKNENLPVCSLIFTARCTLVRSAVLGSHVVCLSVCPSVTLVDQDHIGWKSWKLIARTQPNTFALRSQKVVQGTWGNFGETRGGVVKNGVLKHKSGNISETRKDTEKVTMGGLWELTIAHSNGTIPNLLRPPLPQDWGSHPNQNSNRYYLRNG